MGQATIYSPGGGRQSSEEDLKNEKETHIALSRAVVGNRYRAYHSAGLSPRLHLFSLSTGRGWFFEVSDQSLFLRHSHNRSDHGVQKSHFQNAGFLMGPPHLHLRVGKVFVPARDSHLHSQLSRTIFPGASHRSHFGAGFSRRAHDFPSHHGSRRRLSAPRADMVSGL
jgi:hypothetical protein